VLKKYRLPADHDLTPDIKMEVTADATMGRLHATMIDIIRSTPSLFKIARRFLNEEMQMAAKRSNPDALFINEFDAQGNVVSSMTATQALMGTLLKGPTYLNRSDLVVALRPDSKRGIDEEPDFHLAKLQDVYARIGARIKDAVGRTWDESVTVLSPLDKQDDWAGSRRSVLKRLYVQVLFQEIDIALDRREFDEADAEHCSTVLKGSGIDGFSSLELRIDDAKGSRVMGALVCAPDETGPFYLFQLSHGWKRYPSSQALIQAVLEYCSSGHELHEALMNALPTQAAAALEAADESSIAVELIPLEDEFHHVFLDTVIKKQRADIQYELATADDEELEALWARIDHAIELGDLEDVVFCRMSKLYGETQSDNEPEWLKGADNDLRKQYFELDEQNDLAEAGMSELFAEVGHIQDYARHQLMQGMYNALYYTVEPAEVIVELRETFDFRGTGDEKPRLEAIVRKASLLDLAINGMPYMTPGSVGVTLPEGHEHPAFDGGFVIDLLRKVNIPVRYGAALEALYRKPELEQAIGHFFGRGLASALLAARMQGQLSESSYEQVARAFQDKVMPESIVLGKLRLKQSDERFEDVLTIELKGQGQWILYAPGAPERSVFELSDFNQVSRTVFRWTRHTEGADYMRAQTTVSTVDLPGYLRRRTSTPRTDWTDDRLVVEPFEGSDIDSILLDVARHKISRQVERGGYVSASKLYVLRPSIIQELITLDNRIEGLESLYSRHSSVRPYAVQAHKKCMELVNRHVEEQGGTTEIDPDTVFFDLRKGATRVDDPAAESDGSYRTLTDLFMEGFSRDNYIFHTDAIMYSAVGQDLSYLSTTFVDQMIRESNFGSDYLRVVEGEQNLTLLASQKRQSIFVQSLKFKLKRAALAEHISGRLKPSQLEWISMLTGTLSEDADPSVAQTRRGSRIAPLCLVKGVPVAGCYLLSIEGEKNTDFSLAYTPDAPDGVEIRRGSDVIIALRSGQMRTYFHHRTESGQWGAMARKLHDIATHGSVDSRQGKPKMGDRLPVPVDEVHKVSDLKNNSYRDSWSWAYTNYLQQIHDDVDRLTETVKERFALNLYLDVRKWGGRVVKILPAPFLPLKVIWHLAHMTVDLVRAKRAYDAGYTYKALALLVSAASEAFAAQKHTRKYIKWRKTRIEAKNAARAERKFNSVIDVLNPVVR